jgi:hypothetical protein
MSRSKIATDHGIAAMTALRGIRSSSGDPYIDSVLPEPADEHGVVILHNGKRKSCARLDLTTGHARR